jgi:hypothetical protein
MAIICGLIFISIVISTSNETYFILFIITCFGLANSWSQYLIFPSIIGIDPWWHQSFTNSIIETGYIIENLVYSKLPIFHLIIAETSLLIATGYRFSAMWSAGNGQIIGNILLIYLISYTIFKDYRISLMSALIVATANIPIQLGFMPIPNGLSSIPSLMIIFLLFKYDIDTRTLSMAFIQLFMFILILMHTLGSVFLVVILTSIYISFLVISIFDRELVSKYKKIVIINLLFITSMLSYWMYITGVFNNLTYAIKWGFSIDRFSRTPISSAFLIPQSEILFNYLGLFIFFGLSLIGIFYMMFDKSNKFSFCTSISSLIFLGVSFFPIIMGLSLLQGRWWYISQVLLSIPLSISFSIFLCKIKNTLINKTFLFTIFVTISFLMLVSTNANIDNNTFSQNSNIRFALMDTEIAAAKIIPRLTDNIETDLYYSNCINYILMSNITHDISENLQKRNFSSNSSQTVMIRNTILTEPFWLYTTTFKLGYDPRLQLDKDGYFKIYDNGQVSDWVINRQE